MAFKSPGWYPVAVALTVINLVGVGFATGPAHTTIHAVLALGFGLWAQRLRGARVVGQGGGEGGRVDALGSEFQGRLESLEGEVTNLRRELNEAHERLDFAERLLAQRAEPRRMGPQS